MSIIYITIFYIIHWEYISFPQFRKSESKIFKCNGEIAQPSGQKKKKDTKKYSFLLLRFNCFPVQFLRGITNHTLHPRNNIPTTRTTTLYNTGWMTLLRRKWFLGHTLPRVQRVLVHILVSDQEERMESTLSKSAMTPDWGIYWYTPCLSPSHSSQRKRHIRTLWNSARTNTKSSPRKEAAGQSTGLGQAVSVEKVASTCFPQYIYN